MSITIEDLLEVIRDYNPEEEEIVKKAYHLANKLHEGQFRQSGEPYISHPLNVTYILALMHADRDTLCAGLLHDTIEDTCVTKEEIEKLFNKNIAFLVDGVTKIRNLDFTSKEEESSANIRKIITGITEDARIIIIKLADRLHNMRTLSFKSEFKQKQKALETMQIYVPLAYYLGLYDVKEELEDLSFMYLKKEMYDNIKYQTNKIELESKETLEQMKSFIKETLDKENIPNEIKIRTKNIYGIYKRISNTPIKHIHDLLALKVIVDEVSNCYRALGLVHSLYHPLNGKFKDYISNPKTNMYSSLHTTVFAPDDRLVQVQIRTDEMEKIASNGITSYWDVNKGEAGNVMIKDLNEKFQFVKSLKELNKAFISSEEFVKKVYDELFTDKVYIYTSKGEVIELPKGATPIDFAYKIHTDIGNDMIGALVNNNYVANNYILKNKDRVRIITDDFDSGPKDDWIKDAKTTYAKRKIREYLKNN